MKLTKWLGTIGSLSTVLYLLNALATVAYADTFSPITESQAESVVAGVFHPGKVQSAKEIQDTSGSKEWNIFYTNGDTALVSATTGRVLQFSAIATLSSNSGSMTQVKAISLAKQAVQKLDPDRALSVELDPLHQSSLVQNNQYSVSFTRVVNGIPFPANGFQLKIDKDGEISSYQTTWTDGLTFAPAQNVLSQDTIIQKAASIMTANPKTTLFYYLVPWAKNPELLYLVQTKGGELALYANTGQPLTPPGDNTTSPTGTSDLAGQTHSPWWQNPWLTRFIWGVVSILIGGGIFYLGFQLGANRKPGQNQTKVIPE